jgi:plasmid stabilization system protein ParE
MDNPIPVRWSTRSLRNAQGILEYLHSSFSPNEVDKFELLLQEFEKTVSFFPNIYPKSKQHPGLRKAVVHRNTTIFYVYGNGEVTVIAIQDNRQEEPHK